VTFRLDAARGGLRSAAASLAVLGPAATLERGYAIVRTVPEGEILRDPRSAPPGTSLRIALAGGTLAATSDGAADG
jgi:exodeoxyribonuclease VII large subunit